MAWQCPLPIYIFFILLSLPILKYFLFFSRCPYLYILDSLLACFPTHMFFILLSLALTYVNIQKAVITLLSLSIFVGTEWSEGQKEYMGICCRGERDGQADVERWVHGDSPSGLSLGMVWHIHKHEMEMWKEAVLCYFEELLH
jgi:hypothetical protein